MWLHWSDKPAFSPLLVDYAGFEPVQRLVSAAVVGESPIDPSLAARTARLHTTGEQNLSASVDQTWVDDALDEAVFVDQREVEKREQKHFEQAIGQLERFVDDKVLVSRRERASISEKLRSAWDRRDEVVGFNRQGPCRSGDPSAGREGRDNRAPNHGARFQGRRGPAQKKRLPIRPMSFGARDARKLTGEDHSNFGTMGLRGSDGQSQAAPRTPLESPCRARTTLVLMPSEKA